MDFTSLDVTDRKSSNKRHHSNKGPLQAALVPAKVEISAPPPPSIKRPLITTDYSDTNRFEN